MQFPKILLGINSVLFVLFGLGFVAAPGWISRLAVEAAPATTSALIDMRATYGGMALGIGLFLGACARHAATVRLGLLASLLVLAGIAAGRMIGILVDGAPNLLIWALLGAELLFVVLVLAALRRLRAG